MSLDATVLITDISAFTQRVEKSTPEEVAGVLNDYYYRFTEAVLKFGGIPVKYMGDSFLCYFTGDNHELRAVRAAVQGKETATETISIGISSGPVFVGKLGHPEYAINDIIGETVHLAVRTIGWIGQNAPSGIAATSFTVDPIRENLLIGNEERRQVKGIEKTISLFEITGVKA